jgi:hypothetical protein
MRMTSSLLLAGFLSASTLAFAAKEATKEVLPFIADDYPKALATSRAEKKPIFLETWAPW